MPQVKPEEVRPEVVHTLSVVSGVDEESIKDADTLFEDLGMSMEHKRSCARAFEKIARAHNDKARVTQGDCEKLLTVLGALKLVAKKASTS